MASAIRLAHNNYYKVEDANHLTICKPPSKDHISYSKLLECLKLFVKEKKTPTMPRLPRYQVALEDKANAIYTLLQNESIVALVGMGGIGKTTLSKKVYHNQYEKSSFLENVKSKDINNVKKKLLQDLCDKKLHKDEDVDEYLDEIKQCMISKNVLVVVDDVDISKNLEDLQLLIDKDATIVNCKSKVLVNCRNWQILKNHVKESAKVDMALLEEEKARELFMLHAFKDVNCVTNDLKIISMEIIKACGGLPLSLEVLGCYLRDIHDLKVWKGALHELKGGRNITGSSDNEMLWKTLRISYDHLIQTHQDMFLDIACFFVGFKKNIFYRVYWNGDDSSSVMLILQNLKDRSLIKWAEDGSLYMHEQLRDMGRNIATEITMILDLTKCNRLQFVFDILSHGLETSISIDMKELSTSIGNLNALLELNLSGCLDLQELPTSIGQLNALQELNMSECLCLRELPTSIGQLNALQNLHLKECSSLQELPTSIGQLNALQELNMSKCLNLRKLPTSIGQLSALQNLHLWGCSSLHELPRSICQLSALQNLHLSRCSSLQALPTSIGQLNALENLDLNNCLNLQELPTSIGQLNALQNFHLNNCLNLQELPTSIGQLNALQNLYLSGCSRLQKLPTSISQLNALQNLHLSGCSRLQELPTSIGQLNALQELNMSECLSLRELPTSIGQLSALKKLDLKCCLKLQELPTSIGQLNALQNLHLSECSKLQELPTSIGQLNALRNLHLNKKLHKDEDVDDYLDEIKQCMISKNVLVVVDDVDIIEKLEDLQLLIDKDAINVNCKSKVLVNCQNWQILKNHIRESAKVDMAILEEEKARELFMLHAFKHGNRVTNDLEIISMDIIKACGGLPLSLEVLGCYLCGIQDLEVWKSALHELK
ncbi:unnamed protein product, partial [Sphagnum tenellum]